jgi:hypothetical protein
MLTSHKLTMIVLVDMSNISTVHLTTTNFLFRRVELHLTATARSNYSLTVAFTSAPMSAEQIPSKVRSPGQTAQLGRRPVGPLFTRRSRLRSSAGVVLNKTYPEEGTRPSDGPAHPHVEDIEAIPEIAAGDRKPGLTTSSVKTIREIEACITVARGVLLDASPSDIQSSTTDFAVHVLTDVLEVIKKLALEEIQENEA